MNGPQFLLGKPQHVSEEETMQHIRSILTTDPAVDDQEPPRAFADRHVDVQKAPRRRATDLPELAPAEVLRKARRSLWSVLPLARLKRRHAAYAAAAAAALFYPWAFAGLVLGVPALMLALFLVIGPSRISDWALARIGRIEANDPDRAARMSARLDRFACFWDGVLDKLPYEMVEGLYMPDVQKRADADEWHDAAVADRLARMAQQA